ncbi:bacteriocin ABC transporter [Nitritalea halalkaliphila LW7]|uniref:Bacteriocin ABC transporter n=2 Tax=Nitritalea TaxID=1187887 RepID=I5C3T3_9BACT|nr:bacteriocin ABC transporter [Nitritalea halalkaliphila LW7]
MEDGAELDAHLIESLTGIGTIKRFGAESFVSMKMETRFTDLLNSVYRSGMVGFFTGTSSEFVSRGFSLLIMWVGAGYVLQQVLTPGELMSFYALSGYLTGPISALVGMNKTIQNAWIAADRLFEIMELTEEEKEAESTRYPLPKEPIERIRFEQVHFRYGAKAPVFTDFTAEFQAGKISALVGESGSGKSTLMALLQGIYPIEKGKIWFGGHELRYLTPESLRERIAVVPQDVTLFAGDLLSNIALGDYQPDVERVLALCQRLGMDSFIDALPQGLATHVGEHGATLSGGQKQRVALARALYRDPEIIILDEATAALDAHSERIIQECLLALAQEGKTILCITHRLAAVQQYDEIFVLEAGKVVEKGHHQRLIALQGIYYEMIRKQAVLFQAA